MKSCGLSICLAISVIVRILRQCLEADKIAFFYRAAIAQHTRRTRSLVPSWLDQAAFVAIESSFYFSPANREPAQLRGENGSAGSIVRNGAGT